MLLCAKHSTSISSWKCLLKMSSANAVGNVDNIWRILQDWLLRKTSHTLSDELHIWPLQKYKRCIPLVSIGTVNAACCRHLPHFIARWRSLLQRYGCTFDSDWLRVKNLCTKYLQSTFTYSYSAWLCHRGVCATVIKGNTPSLFPVLITIIWRGSAPLSHT